MRKESFKSAFLLFLFAILIAGVSNLCAQESTLTATVSASKVAQNTVFQIQFELENGSSSDFRPPSFGDFRVVGGPSTGSSMVSINGKVTQSQSWTYSLLATRQGRFNIGAAEVVSGRKRITSRPVSIEVVAPQEVAKEGSSSGATEPVFLRAEVNAESYYPGQQIILTYRLLFRENVQTVSTLSEDDYADFFIQNFSDFSREATYETIHGVQFVSRIIKSVALFAHQSGDYTIDPLLMSVGISAPYPGNQGFFAMRRIQDIQVASEPLTIHILPLPSDAPPSFSGAVGKYQMRTIPGNTQITTDDAYTFRLEITGDGDSRRWDPPAPVTTGEFEVYDPKIIEDKITDVNNQVSNIRSIEYQMIPSSPGDYTVFTPLTYFDPERKKYITIGSDTISLHVTQGQNNHKASSSGDTLDLAPGPLMTIHTNWLKDQFWTSVPHAVVLLLILSGSCLGLVVSYKRQKENQIPEAVKIKADAARNARHQFDLLGSANQSMESKVYFERATEIYYKFLSDRFQIPPSDMDEQKVATYLEQAGVSGVSSEKAISFFHQCLSVRYGGTPGGFTREEMLHHCKEIIDLLST